MTGTDARLVPAAALAWATCLVLTAGPGGARWAAAALGAVLAGLLTWWWRRARRRGAGRHRSGARASTGPPRRAVPAGLPLAVLLVAAATAVASSAAVSEHVRRAGPLSDLVERAAVVDLTGRVVTEPRAVAGWPGQDRWRTVLAVDTVAGRGGAGTAAASVVLLAGPEAGALTVGHRVAVTARLAPADPVDPELALALAVGPPLVLAGPGPLDAAVEAVRSALLTATDPLPADARGLVPGLAVGDTSRLPADLDDAMRVTGLTHVTAVSGGHFAVLFLAVVAVSARLPRPVRAAVTVLVMGAFVILVRPDPPVLRAAVMGLVTVIGTLLRRPARAVPALAATVLALLVLDPWIARSLGFALSVAATAAIVLVAPALTRAWADHVPHLLAQAVAVPVAAQVACAPLLVPLDAGVGGYAVPANLLAAPALVPGTLAGVGAAALAVPAPTPAGWLAWVAAAPAWWIAAVARFLAGLPGARVPVPDGAVGVVLVAVGGAGAVVALLAAARLVTRWRAVPPAPRVVGAGLVAAGLLAVAFLVPGRVAGEWTVAMCDVGQGDMLVVRSGPRSAVVVDVGPEPAAADACLRRLGVDTLDLLVLSHHHLDHVGGLAGALAGRTLRGAVVPPSAEPPAQAREVGRLLAGTPAVPGSTGLTGTAGAVGWRVLAPAGPGPDVNDSSVVVHLDVAGLGVLALGDLSADPQEGVARAVAEAGLRVDVVKVAHHGARDQSRSLAEVAAPAVALVGVGADNDYGHPTDAALDLYRSTGALVLPTDRCGTVLLAVADGRVGASCAGRRRRVAG